MRSVAMVILGLTALLAGCGGGGGGKSGTNTSANDVSVLPTTQLSSEAWFVDNDGRVFGVTYNNAGTASMCVWLPGDTQPKPLSIPAEASSYIIRRMTIGGSYLHINNLDQIGYAGANSASIVNLLTGATVPLTAFPNASEIVPADINDTGVCVGSCKTPLSWNESVLRDRPIMWSAAGEPLGKTLPTDCSCGVVNAINNSGYAVGKAWSDDCGKGDSRAIIWNPENYVTKEILPEVDIHGWMNRFEGIMISDSGYAVVIRSTPVNIFELVSPTGTIMELGTAGDNAVVSAINSQGQVAGCEFDGPKVWNPDGSIIRLPLPFAGARCTPYDINDNGVVVGTAVWPDSARKVAVTWKLSP